MRVCQALVLPAYQRAGHGLRLLQLVQRLALQRDAVVELTVEDPADGFRRLRDTVDLHLCRRMNVFLPGNCSNGATGLGAAGTALADSDLDRIQKATKLTKRQILVCHEASELESILEAPLEDCSGSGIGPGVRGNCCNGARELEDPRRKAFRLRVKRRLHQENRAVLEDIDDKQARKDLLEREYQAHEAWLRTVLHKVRKIK